MHEGGSAVNWHQEFHIHLGVSYVPICRHVDDNLRTLEDRDLVSVGIRTGVVVKHRERRSSRILKDINEC